MPAKKKVAKKVAKKKVAKKKVAKKKVAKKAKVTPIDTSGAADRIGAVLDGLNATLPEATTELQWKTPWQLLVATILSAQCTDERVNKVTPALFERFADPPALAAADLSEIEGLIQSTGFYRNKAKAIQGAAKHLVEQHDAELPRQMQHMVELPGVARKTANLVLGVAFDLATGIVVDTHVKRVAQRLGLSAQSDAGKIERDLMALVLVERWVRFSHQMILHGRYVCQAKAPKCDGCALAACCPSSALFGHIE